MGIWRGGGRHRHSALIPNRATGARRHGRHRKRRGFQKKCFPSFTNLLLPAFFATGDSKMSATVEPLKITERRQRAGQRTFGYGHNGNSNGFY